MSTHIALMHYGELQQFDAPLTLYAQPANEFAADFLGNPRINMPEGRVEAAGAGLVARCGALSVDLQGLEGLLITALLP